MDGALRGDEQPRDLFLRSLLTQQKKDQRLLKIIKIRIILDRTSL